MKVQTSPYLPLSKLSQTDHHSVEPRQGGSEQAVSFGSILEGKLNQNAEMRVKFSKHAASRLNQRGISLSDEQISRLAEGMDKASGKGMKEPLVLIDDLAFIVSTDKKTVITAVGQQQTRDNVFTNIDGAVIN